ncbi:MAG TPA: TonB-dependent receptor [Nitrospirae bacterium]|nr:colicin I receptor precursor [bacterium BMS3Bbin08]HDH13454.1 TonB-dependent receptor [Nitrospirota bacterium]
MYRLWLLLLLLLMVSPVWAENDSIKVEEVVISATRIESPVEETASSVTVITEKDIDKKQTMTVADALKDIPALDVVNTGGYTSVFIRGANSEHTLILIDGIEMNDPVSASRGYSYLSTITTDNIERIEIIRGPQSTLYGSDAIGGVINIITKKGKGKPKLFVSTEGGAHKTYREIAGVSGGNKLVNYSVTASRVESEGISIRNGSGDPEKDGYINTDFSSRIGFTPTENFDIELIFRYIHSISDLDNSSGVLDDPNYILKYKQRFFKTQASFIALGDVWEQVLGFSISDHHRTYSNDIDADHPVDFAKGSYDGNVYKIDWQHNFYAGDFNTVTAGFEYEKESGKSDYYSESAWGPFSSTFDEKTATNRGFYFQEQFKYKKFIATAGFRHDGHSKFGKKNTYRLTSAYTFDTDTRIKGTFGTGFKAPSLFQLYSSYGNESLQPEKTKGLDIGIEQRFFNEKVSAGITYFYNSFKNLIDFDLSTSKYNNISGARTRGLETFVEYAVTEGFSARLSHTYTDTLDKSTGGDLMRRPAHKMTFDGGYKDKNTAADLSISYVGRRDDKDFSYPYPRLTLIDYFIVNIAASRKITGNVQLFGRIENLFAESYEEAFGYNTPGFSAFAGVKLEM